jgi:prepilin-type N-terminal cleavage/methylation domain-containing protein
MCNAKKRHKGFTLAEVLISLLIIAEVATFTIPKILTTQANIEDRAATKEVVGMMTTAFQQAQGAGTVTSLTKAADLTPYLNYIALYTSGNLVDPAPTSAVVTCSATAPCLKMYNGGVLQLNSEYFNGTTNLNCIQFRFDPDGNYTGMNSDITGVSVQFELYYNGFITTRGQAKTGSIHSTFNGFGPSASYDPSWFSW